MNDLEYMIELNNVNKWYGDFHVLKNDMTTVGIAFKRRIRLVRGIVNN